MKVFCTTSKSSSFTPIPRNIVASRQSKLSDVVQADKNLLTGLLISDGNSNHRPIWKEVPNYNAMDFKKVNMKMAYISDSSVKNAKEASRLIR